MFNTPDFEIFPIATSSTIQNLPQGSDHSTTACWTLEYPQHLLESQLYHSHVSESVMLK